MKRNARMAVVLSALVALTMAFASCGKSDSSSKSDASSAASSAAESTAESKAEESKAEESKAEESTAAPAESTAADESNAGGQIDIDTAALTASVWTSATVVKEDGSFQTIDEYAAEVGTEAETIGVNLVFTADGKLIMQGASLGGFAIGTYTVNGKGIVASVNGTEIHYEMAESDGKKMLAVENAQVTGGIKGTMYGANPALSVDDIVAQANAGAEQGAEGGEQAAEGGEQGAEGGEQAAEGGEQAAEGGEQAAEGGEQATEGTEEAAE